MDLFKYDPIDLERPTFRLVNLLKGEGPAIELSLFHASLLERKDTISYEALSYTWGCTEKTDRIIMNGKELGVTLNLYFALQYLRFEDQDRILWVDAICIDQENTKERGHQVRQMRDIYKQADKVIFWLGPATYSTNVVMDSLYQLQKESIKHVCKDWKVADNSWMDLWSAVQPILKNKHSDLQARQREGLQSLLGRSWFRRIWILQEVANAQTALVCCGTKSVSARVFALAPQLIGVKLNTHCKAVLDIMPGPSRRDSWWSQNRSLYTLLRNFRESEAHDPRDMIYASLSMSSDAQNTDILCADYRKSVQEVICDAIRFLFFCDIKGTPTTMQKFLEDFKSFNKTALRERMGSSQTENIGVLLDREEEELGTIDWVVKDAVKRSSGKGFIDFLLQKRGEKVKVTEAVVTAAAGNGGGGKEVLELLLQQRGNDFKVTEAVVIAAVRNFRSGKEVLELLLQQRGNDFKVTEEVVIAAAGNGGGGREVLELLLQQRGNDFKVTEEVVIAAAGNGGGGKEVLELLLQQRGNDFKVTEEVVIAAAGNGGGGKEVLELLLQQRGNNFKVTEEVVIATAGNFGGGREVLELLL